jgi:hypothetical protein
VEGIYVNEIVKVFMAFFILPLNLFESTIVYITVNHFSYYCLTYTEKCHPFHYTLPYKLIDRDFSSVTPGETVKDKKNPKETQM